jgi:DNA-binding response OmpR family regulator
MLRSEDRTILIVAEDEHIRRFLSELFFISGFKVILAGDVTEALDVLLNKYCSLLIADMDMAEMDGIELVVKIRNLGMSLPVIGMSSANKKNEFLSAGADYFLLKPFSIYHLRSLIQALFKE